MAAADSIIRLKVDSSEFDNKIKSATSGLSRLMDTFKKRDGDISRMDEDVMQYVRSLGKMETASKTAKGSVAELSKAFVELSARYNHLTAEQKNSPFGRELKSSLDQIAERTRKGREELSELGRKIGDTSTSFHGLTLQGTDLKSVLGDLGSRFGVNSGLLSVLTTGTVGLTAAIGGSVAAVAAAAKQWADYNEELMKRDTATTVITGLNGGEAEEVSDAVKAMASTYGVDVKEALNAVNTLMQQFGISSQEALQLTRDGLQGMLLDDAPKLLQMIQQYAPSFRDAGIAADQLVAIIHNSEGGLFTDDNMNAIVMGIKNIRLMTKATSDALAEIGINGQDVTKKLNDGTMTIFEALGLVAGKLQETESGSQSAGQVMQQVFGKQGTAAGTNLAKAIATLNTNLEETRNQTGKLGVEYSELEKANERLQKAMRGAFGVDSVKSFANELKTGVINALASIIEQLEKIRNLTPKPSKNGNGVTGQTFDQLQKSIYNNLIERASWTTNGYVDTGNGLKPNRVRRSVGWNESQQLWMQAGREAQRLQQQEEQARNQVLTIFRPSDQTQSDRPEPKKKTKITTPKGTVSTPKTEEQLNTESIQKLTQEYITATDQRRAAIRKEIAGLQERNKEIQALKDEATGKTKPVVFDISAFPKVSFSEYKKELEALKPQFSLGGISSVISNLQNEIKDAPLGSELYDNLTSRLSDASAFSSIISTALKEGIDLASIGADANLWKKITDNTDGALDTEIDTQLQSIVDKMNEWLDSHDLPKITLDVKTGTLTSLSETGKATSKEWSEAASAVRSVGSALTQIENPAAKVAGIVAEAIATVALGMAKAAANNWHLGTWGWIAAIASGTAAMISTIAAIHSATGYAQGGIVDGNGGGFVGGGSFSGDNIGNVRLNSGELVLNRAQQGNLAAQLDNQQQAVAASRPYLSGEYIYLGLTAWLKRTGRGELVTSNISRRGI